jgi:hypothetical protein
MEMKSLSSLSNSSLIGHSLVILPGKTWDRFTQEKKASEIDFEEDVVVGDLKRADNGKIAYISASKTPLLVRWSQKALAIIFGGVLALGMTVTLVPIGFACEIVHYGCQQIYAFVFKDRRERV